MDYLEDIDTAVEKTETTEKENKMDSGNNLPGGVNYPGGDRQQFCVSWNSHQSNMHSAFPKLLSSEQFVDVTLACDGGSIKCHKVVLSACSDYLERLLLEIPCTHPIIFLRDMRMWELQALVEFMYRGEVYVEQQQLTRLMQAAEALQVRGLSSQGRENNDTSSPTGQSPSSNPSTPTSPSKHHHHQPHHHQQSQQQQQQQQHQQHQQQNQSHGNLKNDEPTTPTINSSDSVFPILDTQATVTPTTATLNNINATSNTNPPPTANTSTFMNIEHTEALQHLEKALSSCEATLTETPGMVKMEPDEQFSQQDKPYSISMVPTSNSNCSNPASPFPAIEGYQRRQRRSEAELKQASDMVARGMTFQVASEKYNIPISTIRFYMVRKGILQRRKRGRGSSNVGRRS